MLPDVEKNPYTMWLIVGGIILMVALCVIPVVRRRKREVVIPPDIVAMEALDAMSGRPIPCEDHKEVDAWYVELSGIVRCYIEGRFSLHAPKLTTEEVIDRAKTNGDLTDEQKLLIRRLLERSDRVKFADYVPDKEVSVASLAEAKQFVKETRPQPESENGTNPEVKEGQNA